MSKQLSPALIEQFWNDGFLFPVDAFDGVQAKKYRNLLEEAERIDRSNQRRRDRYRFVRAVHRTEQAVWGNLQPVYPVHGSDVPQQ